MKRALVLAISASFAFLVAGCNTTGTIGKVPVGKQPVVTKY